METQRAGHNNRAVPGKKGNAQRMRRQALDHRLKNPLNWVKQGFHCLTPNLGSMLSDLSERGFPLHMRPPRLRLIGYPHRYAITARCALDQELLADPADIASFLAILGQLQRSAELRIQAYAIGPASYTLILQHREQLLDNDHGCRERWARLGGRSLPPDQIRHRLCDLGCLMQSLAQRFSRAWHQAHGGRGSIWAERYRACLLADDSALLAAVCAVERLPACRVSRLDRSQARTPRLGTLPLTRAIDGGLWVTDEAPLGSIAIPREEVPTALAEFAAEIDASSQRAHQDALERSWALGRPESLVDACARLGRASGRGRHRRLHELDDSLGLCGVWG